MKLFYKLVCVCFAILVFLYPQNLCSQNRGFFKVTDTLDERAQEVGKYYAFLIANQEYLDQAINQLSEPIQDAGRVKDVLVQSYGFDEKNIMFLKNPKRSDIYQVLEQLVDEVGENDNLLIFYAGHGFFDEKRGEGYWLPADAREKVRDNWISNADIRDNLRGIKARHILLISDACFSGGIFKMRNAFSDASASTQELLKKPSRRAITSGTLNVVPDKSVFVEYLVKYLQENKDQFLSAQHLFASIQEPVTNNSPNQQLPQYGVIQEAGDEGGDFIFFHPTGAAIEPPSIDLTSSVQDASVYLDGQLVGKATPKLKIENITSGLKTLEVHKDGYAPYTQKIQIAENGSTKIDIALEQLKLANLVFKSPLEGRLFINNQGNGTLINNRRVDHLAWGDYEIRVEKNGYKPFIQRLSLNEYKDYEIAVDLKPVTAKLRFKGNYTALAYVSDQQLGKVPASEFDVPVGEQTVVVSRKGYEQFEREMNFTADNTYTIQYALQPKTTMNSLWRSMLWPGWGQLYHERSVMGTFLGVAFIAAAAGTVQSQLDYTNKMDDYNKAAQTYQAETNAANIGADKQAMLSTYNHFTTAKSQRLLLGEITVGVYAFNLLDVLLFTPSVSGGDVLSLRVAPSSNSLDLQAKLGW
ncbi:MAG: PEGA domain-containing protein [Bacteroidota bacterium]